MERMAQVLVLVGALLVVELALAAPVPEADRVPIDLRRTTLVVRDIDNSLALYRDVLGMQVIYDNRIRTPRDAASDAEAERASRLVFLRANDNFVGVLGLLQYVKPKKERELKHEAFEPGTIVLLFNADNVEDKFAAAAKVKGVKALSEPRLTHYPSYDGGAPIEVKVSVLFDPDGFVIELNELVSDLRQ